jgi:electron transport complex protein RnfC
MTEKILEVMLMSFNSIGGVQPEAHKITRSYGGVHPADKKSPANAAAISTIALPPQVVIPMSQHIGAPCTPLVAVGDEVKLGQKIGDSPKPVSAPIHASVSGKVIAIEPRLNSMGNMVTSVVIQNDGKDTPADTMVPAPAEDLENSEKIAALIREAGIVGMGGATFPTAFKITSGWGKVDTVIINGAECEPYITSDHRTMLEHPVELLKGIQLIMKACKVSHCYFAIEKNKQFAIDLLNFKGAAAMGIQTVALPCRYPQGAEKTLVHTITGREVPPGGLPAAVGCAVFNTFTSYSVYRAAYEGWPAIERVVTVTGSAIAEPKNVKVRVGTPMNWVFEQTGGFAKTPWKIIMGGPMMGLAQYDLNVPCGKGTAALVCFAADEDKTVGEPVCIRCGQCIQACPMKLQPIYMYMYEEKGDIEMMKKLNLTDCVECGACTYICPGRLHLTHAFKTGKAKIQAYDAALKARAEAAAAKKEAN